MKMRGPFLCLGLVLLILVLGAGSILVGRVGLLSLPDVWNAVTTPGSPYAVIVGELRLPRALLAIMLGFALGCGGAALQGLTRNPLAEPGLIGVSGGAALGAVLTFYSGLSASWGMALPWGGIAGAAVCVVALLALAGRSGDILSLIVAGVTLNILTGALTALALNFAPNPFAAYELMFWLMGSLADRSLDHVAMAAPFVIAGILLLLTTGRGLDALAIGEDAARSLGLSLGWLQLRLVGGCALCVGAAVAVCGSVGFVGLIAPHLVRALIGHRPGRLLLPSGLAGAVLVLVADIGIRLLPSGPELRLGVATALAGAPFFLWLAIARRAGLR